MGEKLLCIGVSFGFLLQALAMRRIAGAWAAPACLFNLFWFGFTVIPLVAMWQAEVNVLALAYLMFASLFFSGGGLVCGVLTGGSSGVPKRSYAYDDTRLKQGVLLCSIAALVCLVANSYIQGISLSQILSDFNRSAAEYADKRYAEEIKYNVFITISNLLCYSAAAVSGFVLGQSRNKLHGLCWVAFALLPSVVVLVTQSAKGMLFLSFSFVFGGVVVSRYLAGKRTLLGRGELKVFVGAACALIPLVLISFLSRGLFMETDSDAVYARLITYAASYTCAHLYAFSDWFSWYLGDYSTMTYVVEPTSFGFFTFMPIFRVLGDVREVPMGTYDEYFSYGDYLISNIYTMYRGVVTDFGLIGSLVFMFFVGAFCHWCFLLLRLERCRAFAVASFVVMVGAFYTSSLVSLFMWMGPYLLLAFLWLLFEVIGRVTRLDSGGIK